MFDNGKKNPNKKGVCNFAVPRKYKGSQVSEECDKHLREDLNKMMSIYELPIKDLVTRQENLIRHFGKGSIAKTGTSVKTTV